jgi:hypothetical protein
MTIPCRARRRYAPRTLIPSRRPLQCGATPVQSYRGLVRPIATVPPVPAVSMTERGARRDHRVHVERRQRLRIVYARVAARPAKRRVQEDMC